MKNFNLNGSWTLYPQDNKALKNYTKFFEKTSTIDINLPSDIHSSLINNKIIKDPYKGTNELDIQWVGRNNWIIEKTFTFNGELDYKSAFMQLSNVDTIASLYINDNIAYSFDNQFKGYCFNIKPFLIKGNNNFKFIFYSAENEAIRKAKELPYIIPFSQYPVYSPNRNLVRKTQAHSGWDWGPCIMAMGIYDDLNILFTNEGYISCVKVNTIFSEEVWSANIELNYYSLTDQILDLYFAINKTSLKLKVNLIKGENKIVKSLNCKDITPWFPNGEGEQKLYSLITKIGESSDIRKIGFREIFVKNTDGSLVISVNGRDIFMKGSNWIPQDALPGRYNKKRYEYLLESCREVNMNMIRVWGGGLYEKDDFYKICDEKGILIWQDCMFSCSMYPSSKEFLSSVEKELIFQIRRLQSHPCLALWCGNNEDLGAISWYDETKNNRDRYVIDYDRLNEGCIGKIVKQEDPMRTWWPSSPSAGEGDYSDNWHDDSKGDMHFWSVWHEGKDFEKYYSIKPRFVSEFGYQSFPSLSTVMTYANEDELNLTSETMEHHQKNPRGNTIILENFTRYYLFPSSFEKQLYLSQVQQALAMKMAIEYFRTLRGHCMGSLYWQLNDNWPVASWASIDYEGKWKALQYEARRFYNPLLLTTIKREKTIEFHLVNDSNKKVKGQLIIEERDFNGKLIDTTEITESIKALSAKKLFEKSDFEVKSQDGFIVCYFKNEKLNLFTYCLLDVPKKLHFKKPNIKTEFSLSNEGLTIKLTSDVPAFNVMLDSFDVKGIFSDNNFLLLGEKNVNFKNENNITLEEFKKNFTVLDLYNAGH